jgi:hypothetical protein
MVGNDSANASHNKISEMWQANKKTIKRALLKGIVSGNRFFFS